MSDLIGQRMYPFSNCLSPKELLGLALIKAVGMSHSTPPHVKICKYCRRDIGQLEGKLPDYSEFGMMHLQS